MALLRVDEVRELQRVTHEEDRRVVADEIPVAFGGVTLDREAAHVAFRVGGAEFTGNGREADQKVGLLADRIEQLGVRILRDILRYGERAERTPAFGMNNALGNALTVLVRELFEQLIILKQQRAACAGGQRVLIIGDGRASRSRELGRVCHW